MSALQFLQRIGAINLPEDVLKDVSTPSVTYYYWKRVSTPEAPTLSYESARASVLERIKQQIASIEAESNDRSARLKYERERVKLAPSEVDRIQHLIADLAAQKASCERTLSDEDELRRLTISELERQMSEHQMQMSEQQLVACAKPQPAAPLQEQRLNRPLANKIAEMIDQLVDDAVTRRLQEITDRTK